MYATPTLLTLPPPKSNTVIFGGMVLFQKPSCSFSQVCMDKAYILTSRTYHGSFTQVCIDTTPTPLTLPPPPASPEKQYSYCIYGGMAPFQKPSCSFTEVCMDKAATPLSPPPHLEGWSTGGGGVLGSSRMSRGVTPFKQTALLCEWTAVGEEHYSAEPLVDSTGPELVSCGLPGLI